MLRCQSWNRGFSVIVLVLLVSLGLVVSSGTAKEKALGDLSTYLNAEFPQYIANQASADSEKSTVTKTESSPVARLILSPVHIIKQRENVFTAITTKGEDILFDASNSYDPDGSIQSYFFNFGDGSTSGWIESPRVRHFYPNRGLYSIASVVKDDQGNTGKMTGGLIVGESIKFTGTVKEVVKQYDFGGFLIEIIDISQGPLPDCSEVAVLGFQGQGLINLPNQITDIENGDTVKVFGIYSQLPDSKPSCGVFLNLDGDHYMKKVNQNSPPQADFDYSPSDPKVGETISFSDQSTDSDGTIQKWNWSFGDGFSSTKQNPTHSYTAGDIFSVCLSVEDNEGATDKTCKDIKVEKKANKKARFQVIAKSFSQGQINDVEIGYYAEPGGITHVGSTPFSGNYEVGTEMTFEAPLQTTKEGYKHSFHGWKVNGDYPNGNWQTPGQGEQTLKGTLKQDVSITALYESIPVKNDQPDLTITDVWWNPSQVSTGDKVEFHYTVKNKGNARAEDFGSQLYIDGKQMATRGSAPLDPQESKNETFSYHWEATSGSHDIMVKTDWSDALEESNENNNSKVETLNIGEIDAKIIDMSVEPGTYKNGEVVKAEAIVKNTGTDKHTFFLGFSVKGPEGNWWDNKGTTGRKITLSAGEQNSYSLEWKVEDKAPGGQYDVLAVIWEESVRNNLQNRLDQERIRNAFTITTKEENYALLVGITDYEGDIPAMGCSNDAKEFYDLLVKGYDYPENHVKKLLDGEATKQAIKNKLDKFQSKVDSNDTFVFLFSGHGHIVDKAEGLKTYNANNSIWSWWLESKFKNFDGRVLSIIESCHSGGMVWKTDEDSGDNKEGIKGDNKVILTSSKVEESSYTWWWADRGYWLSKFIYSLLQAFRYKRESADKNDDNQVSISEAFSYIDDDLGFLFIHQHPQMVDNYLSRESNNKEFFISDSFTPYGTSKSDKIGETSELNTKKDGIAEATFSGSSLSKISILSKKNLAGQKVALKIINKTSALDLPGDVYSVFCVNSSVEPEDIDSVQLTFSISKDWLSAMKLDKNNFYLQKFYPSLNSWKPLKTEVVQDSSLSVTFKAKSPSFSIFYVGANNGIFKSVASHTPGVPSEFSKPDLYIGDKEILWAVSLWLNRKTLPTTDKIIYDKNILRLVKYWEEKKPITSSVDFHNNNSIKNKLTALKAKVRKKDRYISGKDKQKNIIDWEESGIIRTNVNNRTVKLQLKPVTVNDLDDLEELSVKLYDLSGSLVKEFTKSSLNLSRFENGLYLYTVEARINGKDYKSPVKKLLILK